MNIEELVHDWFGKWDSGDYLNLPLTDDFSHTSPYGTINGKPEYVKLVAENEDKFLGHTITIHDEIFEGERACVRYTVAKGDFSMEASEWLYAKDGLLREIVAYYNVDQGPLTLYRET